MDVLYGVQSNLIFSNSDGVYVIFRLVGLQVPKSSWDKPSYNIFFFKKNLYFMLKFKLWLLQNIKIIIIINLSVCQAKWNTTWYSHNFDILVIKKIIIIKLKLLYRIVGLGTDLIGLSLKENGWK